MSTPGVAVNVEPYLSQRLYPCPTQ